MLIAPQPSGLRWARGTIPTAIGAVTVATSNAATFTLEAELPAGAQARTMLPGRAR